MSIAGILAHLWYFVQKLANVSARYELPVMVSLSYYALINGAEQNFCKHLYHYCYLR